ncbi:MAG TPA: hypothetical protein ENG14_00980, partial [Thermodesulforhabdus norvegica]|nr:hypothetical protein [Thermodesulforhabdus norvegica]
MFGKRVVAITLICAWLAVSMGCATTQQGQEQQQAAVAGGALGAITGGLIGYALGGKKGMVAGAIAGGA